MVKKFFLVKKVIKMVKKSFFWSINHKNGQKSHKNGQKSHNNGQKIEKVFQKSHKNGQKVFYFVKKVIITVKKSFSRLIFCKKVIKRSKNRKSFPKKS